MNVLKLVALSVLSISMMHCGAPEDTNEESGHVAQQSLEETPSRQKEVYNIGFYNVENLFDIYDDPNTEDEWFLPSSETNWNEKRYLKKLHDLAKVIDALNPEKGGPDLLGLCEVENKTVVEELTEQSVLSANHYSVVHYESPDSRGIDVAAVYNSEKFELITSESIFVAMPQSPKVKTRDILYVQLKTNATGERLHFYVNHWSSRRKGEKETYFKRKNCATTLVKHMSDMQLDFESDNVIIVGDMNDYPDNESIYSVLGAKQPDSDAELINLQYDNHQKGLGTYNHQGEWGCLDNVIVSEALLDNVSSTDAHILKEDWMLYKGYKGDGVPNKTYGGSKYYGGYSDHLPVYFVVNL